MTMMIVLILGCPTIDAAFQSRPSISVTFVVPASTSLGIPIVAAYVINNTSKVPLRVDVGEWNRVSGLRLELTKPDGTRQAVQDPDPAFKEGIHQGGRFEVAPGATVRVPFVLDKWLMFSETGIYRLSLKLMGSFTVSDPSLQVDVERTAVKQIQVMPRDRDAIERRCKELLAIVRARPTLAAEFEASEELSNFPDVLAIPFMVDATAVMSNPWRAIDGIGRIGGPAAREALTGLTRSPKPDIAAAAKQALARIKRPSVNPVSLGKQSVTVELDPIPWVV